MGFFDFLKKKVPEKEQEKKAELLRWQTFVMTDCTNELILTEQELKILTIQQAENDLRIMKDSAEIVEKTIKPDVLFSRLNLMVEKADHLCELEKYFALAGASIKEMSPSEMRDDIMQKYQEAIKDFLVRYFSDTFDKAEAMKTEKGKAGKYQKFYDSLQEYYCYMNNQNIDYIETKYRAYSKT